MPIASSGRFVRISNGLYPKIALLASWLFLSPSASSSEVSLTPSPPNQPECQKSLPLFPSYTQRPDRQDVTLSLLRGGGSVQCIRGPEPVLAMMLMLRGPSRMVQVYTLWGYTPARPGAVPTFQKMFPLLRGSGRTWGGWGISASTLMAL